jgi:hypothetical protein
MKLDNNIPENNFPNENNAHLRGNNFPVNNIQNQAQHEDNLSLDLSSKNNNITPDFLDSNITKKQSQNINNNFFNNIINYLYIKINI